MLALETEGNIQALAAIKKLTGHQVRMTPMSEIIEIQVTDESVTVLIVVYRYEERRKDCVVTGRGIKLVRFTQIDLVWHQLSITAWDDQQVMEMVGQCGVSGDMPKAQLWLEAGKILANLQPFEAFAINTYGPGQTVDAWLDQKVWERRAGRAGASRYPMDTWERVNQGLVPSRMASHWKRG